LATLARKAFDAAVPPGALNGARATDRSHLGAGNTPTRRLAYLGAGMPETRPPAGHMTRRSFTVHHPRKLYRWGFDLMKLALTGASVHRPKPAASFVEAAFPELRIVSDELWQAAQTRLAAEAVATHPAGRQAFWERRRPKHLLTGKVACGCCGGAFSLLGKDYLGCSRAKNAGSCRNTTRVRRSVLERQVLAALGSSLMRPEALEAFCDAFIAEWNRMATEMSSGARAKHGELKVIERKIANLVDAIEDGLADPGVKQRLEELRARQQALVDQDGQKTMPAPPALHPNLAQVYAKRVATLREALDAGDGEEVLEAARNLIETVVISPPGTPGDPPGIELKGNLMAMLKAGGVNISVGGSIFGSCLTAMLAGSTKEEQGKKFTSSSAFS